MKSSSFTPSNPLKSSVKQRRKSSKIPSKDTFLAYLLYFGFGKYHGHNIWYFVEKMRLTLSHKHFMFYVE